MEEINEKLHLQLLDFDETKRKEWVEGRKPFSVLFELTSSCNMNCVHCYLHNNHISDCLSTEDIIRIIDILYEKGILFLTLTGGEIFTRNDFLQIYLYAKKKGFLVELFTNGLLVSDEMVAVFKQYPPLLIDVSIYGACEDTYKKVTGISGAFERVIANCKKLKDAGLRVFLKSPILTLTLGDLDEMKRIAESIQIPFIYTFELCPTIDKSLTPRSYQVPLSVSLKNEFDNYYEQLNQGKRSDKDNDNRFQVISELGKNDHIFTCNVAMNSFVIDYEGRMLPCMKLRHAGIKLTDNNFDEIWDSFNRYHIAKASSTYVCRGCDARYYCDICPAECELLFGDVECRPNSFCKPALIRKALYEGEITYDEALKKAEFYE